MNSLLISLTNHYVFVCLFFSGNFSFSRVNKISWVPRTGAVTNGRRCRCHKIHSAPATGGRISDPNGEEGCHFSSTRLLVTALTPLIRTCAEQAWDACLAGAADAGAADAAGAAPRTAAAAPHRQRHLLDVNDDPVVLSVAPHEGHLPPRVRGTGRDVGRWGLPGGGEEGRSDRRGRGAGRGGGGA